MKKQKKRTSTKIACFNRQERHSLDRHAHLCIIQHKISGNPQPLTRLYSKRNDSASWNARIRCEIQHVAPRKNLDCRVALADQINDRVDLRRQLPDGHFPEAV